MYFAYHNLVNSVCYIQAKTHDTVQTWLLQTFVHANLDHECYFSILGYLKRCRVQVLTLVLHNVKKKVFPDPSLYHLWEHVSLDSTASFTHKTWFFSHCVSWIYLFFLSKSCFPNTPHPKWHLFIPSSAWTCICHLITFLSPLTSPSPHIENCFIVKLNWTGKDLQVSKELKRKYMTDREMEQIWGKKSQA